MATTPSRRDVFRDPTPSDEPPIGWWRLPVDDLLLDPLAMCGCRTTRVGAATGARRGPSYTHGVRRVTWDHAAEAESQLAALVEAVREPGLLVVGVGAGGDGSGCRWSALEPWTRARAVTVADISGAVASPALEVALACDLVFVRRDAELLLPAADRPLPPGLLWALGRAGRAALRRGLLETGPVPATAAVVLGLAQAEVAPDAELPLPRTRSRAALTAARDLMRARSGEGGGLQLELASFRLLFAVGDPEEGARAFLERREAEFESGTGYVGGEVSESTD